ncbi:hypothetical protein COHA_001841 [Chlorella ohadii]|uniref:Uncharacterized protein n=1 Tax=Chlorella ohadii TaxID=2649997 RepID=A0AAD5DX16_9CHLO|nr:hypothetical protein COHA_001841 [Chlorella ohadii]
MLQCNASSKPEGPHAIICMACEAANASRCTNCNGDLSGELEYGFYPDADGVCVKCPAERCMRCDGEPLGACTKCAQGWGLAGGQCKQCTDKEHCRRCDGDAAKCQECEWGFFADDQGRCTACAANCGSCNSTTACLECIGAYTIDPATQLCVACAEGCGGCSDGVDTCEWCDSGYTANTTDGSLCQKCADPHCTICVTGPTSCTICDDPEMKYGPDLQQGDCKLCALEHCANCQEDYKACRWCLDGYWWNAKEGKCTPCQTEHCRMCATNGDDGLEECNSCEDGYDFDEAGSGHPKCVKAAA